MKREPHNWSLPSPGEKNYWRSLEQLSSTPAFQEFVDREFPDGASELSHPVSRRSFMHLMGASMAMAGLVACRRPVDKIVPFVKQPEQMTLGVAKHYATSFALGQGVLGLIVESHEGRPTKIEGNPQHPASLGSSHVFAQASLWELYDPDRSQQFLMQGKPAGESDVLAALQGLRKAWEAKQGAGLHILSGTLISPSMLAAQGALRKALPKATWHTWEPLSDDNVREASRLRWTADRYPLLQLDRAQIVVALDADPLGIDPDAVRNARGFSARRNPENGAKMNRLYAVEPAWTLTGTLADHRLRVRPSEVSAVAIHLALALQAKGASLPALPTVWKSNPPSLGKPALQIVSAMAEDLWHHREEGVVLTAGSRQPAAIHLLVQLLNDALGATGKTVELRTQADPFKVLDRDAIRQLAHSLQSGEVHTLVCLGTNPVYNAPADLNFASCIQKAKHVVHLGHYRDETTPYTHIHIPQSHYLESWGDALSTDGTYSVVQPLISPLYSTWSDLELALFLCMGEKSSAHSWVRRNDKTDDVWLQKLRQGWGAQLFPEDVTVESAERVKPSLAQWTEVLSKLSTAAPSDGYEVLFCPDYAVYDGRFANNGWLQEFPDPITKLVWDNAAIISEATARNLGIKENELLAIEVQGKTIELVVHVQPGQAEKTIALPLGYGRASSVGRIATGAGFNVYPIRHSNALGFDRATSVRRTGKKYEDPRDMRDIVDVSKITGLVSTQDHFSLEGRPLYREGDLATYRKNPAFAKKEPTDDHLSAKNRYSLNTLWERPAEFDKGQQWGMAIDLSSCTGCGACTIACQVENNIPIVGKPQVRKGREMHWIRIDRYFEGSTEDPHAVHQPVTCMHCENAPCENVCPVAATAHSPDGLNDMTYNRCIGTRYCSNNCPYKVRRFNFLDWRAESGEDQKEVASLKYNPDVTVRSRGVMEKCTYCVQRIRGAQKDAKLAGKATVEDGKIAPACAQACPTQAITFGDIRDTASRVYKKKVDPRNYAMLAELNVQPRTTYLAAVRNPNPALSGAAGGPAQKGTHHE